MSKVVIFGATGHIGKALALQLHSEGVPLHLAGRNLSELRILADQLGASCSEFDAFDNASIATVI